MKAILDYKEVEQDWEPPFNKKIDSQELLVQEGTKIGKDDDGKPIFIVKEIQPEKVLVEHSPKFTLKGHEHPEKKQIWITKADFESFSALWTKNGVTKKLRLRETIPE
ncbi:MAG TPA: hypothetical protein VJK05_05995 [archaeon]|nr:hypothetical protein [archaeon]